VSVLSERLEPVAPQEIGEVCVSGNGLSPGYWRDPESTSNVFTRHSGPHGDAALFRTGDLGYVGADGQVYLAGTREPIARSGGHKFEIGEVEAALESLGSVQAAAVVAAATETDGSVLCCAYVPAAGLNVLPAELRADLAVLLPPYMLPTRWKAFDRLPQTPDGAVERDQLRHWFTENTGLNR
jgi:acyl-CoA synthetase (AMP-forming)/AMP-acid ligase II